MFSSYKFIVIIQRSLEGKFAIICQIILTNGCKCLESLNEEIWVENIFSTHFTAKDRGAW